MDKSKVNFSKPMLIQSVAFKDVFLRMDGKGISTTCGAGAGKVNCQRSMAPTGAFKVQKQTDGTFTIESSKYPGVFLRMDGNGIHAFAGSGSGRVNCQFGASAWERFKLHEQSDGSYIAVFNKTNHNNEVGKYIVETYVDGTMYHSDSCVLYDSSQETTIENVGNTDTNFRVTTNVTNVPAELVEIRHAIWSAAFPNVFLRMDGNNPSRKEEDFGTVNCQYGAGAYEKFYLQNMPEIKNVKDMFNKITK